MKRGFKRLVVLLLAFVLCANVSLTASATGATETTATTSTDNKQENTELTEEEKKMQEELDKAYAIPTESNAWEGWPEGPGTYGEAAIVMEASTGTILYAKNIDAKEYPASITKVLTALLALENGNLTDKVTFSHDSVAFLQPGDSSVGLKEGNEITLEQALYAMLLASANEAAYAVGENIGTSMGHDYNWFIEQMNAKVSELGGVNSHFVNTNGLHDENHYTCARDMALIGKELFKYPEFFKIVQTLEYKIPKSDTVEQHVFQQKDKLLRPQNANYYKYAIGGKTGYTSDALSTLITMAEKGDMQLVCVVLRTHGKNIYPDTKKLCNYAFKKFQKMDISTLETSEDISGFTEETNYVVVPKKVDFSQLTMEVTPNETEGSVPSTATLAYSYNGNVVGTVQASLSESYIQEHYADQLAADKKDADSEKDDKTNKSTAKTDKETSGIKGILSKFLKWSDRSKTEKIIILGLSAAFIVLVLLFVIICIHQKIKRNRKKKRSRHGK